MKRYCVLIVDDEPNIRSSLTRLFQRNGYETVLAENGVDAFALLKKIKVTAVISDYIMPGQSGVDFLRGIKAHYPGMIRMILSGRADMGKVMGAVDEGIVSHFLLKPWDNRVLLETLRQAIHEREHSAHFRRLLQADEELLEGDPGDINENLELTYPGISSIRESDNGAIIIDD